MSASVDVEKDWEDYAKELGDLNEGYKQ